jgi:hypothetical protein
MSFLAAALALAARPASAQIADPVRYTLSSPPSTFEWGCFGPCECPILDREPLTGTFSLRRNHVDPLFEYYDVLGVQWKIPGASTSQAVTITGAGVYRRGGEVALTQELTLDLSFDGGPVQRFTSGVVPVVAPFPEIAAKISLHDMVCLDSVLTVDANPFGLADVPPGREPQVAVAPNPFAGATDLAFAVPVAGRVDLGVFDVTGRQVASVVSGEWLEAGRYHHAWDGRRQDGTAASPGLYLVRVRTPLGAATRVVVKLR